MFIYRQSEPGLFTVGHYNLANHANQFVPESDHDTREAAADRCNFLNGGRTGEAARLSELIMEAAAKIEAAEEKKKRKA